ncbi:jg2157 [Pararge aegeria aegeria]|uniref:Jg2157 protein n=1 Tax=Pararge aegeria aegeria TaxID=348720 RepID=A0A8S4QX52_9NEOP|nr:jg2157 [Pararge aegeria aegeria]
MLLEKMEQETDMMISAKMKDKGRRRSSIFSLLKRQKKLARQSSEPCAFPLNRKYSVDSAILTRFKETDVEIANGNADSVSDLSHCNGG